MAQKTSSSPSLLWTIVALVLGFVVLNFVAGMVWTVVKWSLIAVAAVLVFRMVTSGSRSDSDG